MSAAAAAVPANGTWQLWRSQMAAIVWMELKKNFITKRGFWIYLLAAAPALLVWLHTIVAIQRPEETRHDLSKDTAVLAVLFSVFILRPAVYFGCVGIFTYLFRGEVVERSLHYYFLAPVRREVIVLSKYIAGAITAVTFFGVSTFMTFWGMYGHYPTYELNEFMTGGPGMSHLMSYMGITALACIAWGAVFTWMGIKWRNPIVPSVSFLLWETINMFLPAWLRPLSVLHYLQSMTPVQGDLRGPGLLLGQTADPVPGWLAVICLLGITVGMLYLSAYQLRRSEISYSSD
jgi:ABC-type transport system involved in multi-copper enzyme maturation permease subunit